jgi:hypothetical protein
VVTGRSHRPGGAAPIFTKPTEEVEATPTGVMPRHEGSRQCGVYAGETATFLIAARPDTTFVMRFSCAARDRRGAGGR